MTSARVAELIALPLADLRDRARVPFAVVADQAAVLEHFAQSLIAELERPGPVRLILPVGPVRQYAAVVEECNRRGISWRNVTVFQMDEFCDWQGRPVPLDHPLSFEGYMRRELYGRLRQELRPLEENLHFPHPFRPDEISEAIAQGGVDACFGGIGYHGHVAFNEPPLSRWCRIGVDELRESLTRVVVLGSDSILVQSINCAGGSAAAIPPMAVTLGMRDILASRRLRLYCAGGERHRTVFRITLAGDVMVEYPSTLVQGHPGALVITDETTARPVHVGLA
ncbi:MAG: hypothetical protein FJW40_04500 [Acidobacteria bacterium]|nr:hypothetical protein [Acidobacteriota bacterium]